MKKFILFILLNILLILYSKAQSTKKILKDNQLWLSYSGQIRVSDKWAFWFDASYRRKDDFFNQPFQAVVRPGVIYFLTKDIAAGAGYAYFIHYPSGEREISQPEHRIWEQVHWTQKGTFFNLRHAIRMEHRFRRKYMDNEHLSGDYNFNNRIRYNLTFLMPINQREIRKGTFFLSVNDEVMINFGKEIVFNYFDQNRLGIGLGYQFDKSASLYFGYMNVFQQLPSGTSFNLNHVIRVSFAYNMDLRKAE